MEGWQSGDCSALLTRRGESLPGFESLSLRSHGLERLRLGVACHGEVWLGAARYGKARQGAVRRGVAWHFEVWLGLARQGKGSRSVQHQVMRPALNTGVP